MKDGEEEKEVERRKILHLEEGKGEVSQGEASK